jgi:OmpA-OmpF porin, OOP family
VKNYGFQEKSLTFSSENRHCADTIDIGTTGLKYLPAVTIRVNVYYDFDKYRLSDEAKESIDRLVIPLFGYFPEGIIEIGSHTDNKGTAEYNLALSQKRSESIVSYIISKGIPAERVVAKGYGMSEPIAPNSNPDGSDNPEGRQMNRRTEFRVVGQVPSTGKE